MPSLSLSSQRVLKIVGESTGDAVSGLVVEVNPLHGGLVSAQVDRVTARYRDGAGRRKMFRFVVKHLQGEARREAVVYDQLSDFLGDYAPRLLGMEKARTETLLFLEWVPRRQQWPWKEHAKVRSTAAHLARLHERLRHVPEVVTWDYDAELEEAATRTVQAIGALPAEHEFRHIRRALPAARRLHGQVREVRRQLLAATSLPSSMIHGDFHAGNVLLRRCSGQTKPVMLDWARARHGSPLEDLSPWLQSLAYWEPEVKRRHDRVLVAYLRARGLRAASSEVRDAYWLASGLNALAGALTWNVHVYQLETNPKARFDALKSAEVWARSLRQADRRWRS